MFLRARVDESGKTLAALAAAIDVSRSQISVYLGGKIPTQQFVTAIVNATVPAPLRERCHTEADRLLRDALHPPPAPPAAGPAPTGFLELAQVQARQIETYDRLTRSLEQQDALRQTADNSAKLVMVLHSMIHELRNRITSLASERDQLPHTGHDTLLETVQRKLGRAEAQEEKARQELERAEEQKRHAEELAARLQPNIDKLAGDLDRLRRGPSPDGHLPGLASAVPPLAHDPVSEDPEGDDFDLALARASTINDTDAEAVDRVITELAHTVPDSGQDVLDNPSTSTDAPDNIHTEQNRWHGGHPQHPKARTD
ncbi:hypothetical protein ABZ891_24870 [Streptomyces sp. NPDC047023]|uniref:helix-turn-helix domain-containing protein n=1 Tax=Streptomyces sp. NPDC047023 TaxID=3155139 RepID=UPI0033EBB9C5